MARNSCSCRAKLVHRSCVKNRPRRNTFESAEPKNGHAAVEEENFNGGAGYKFFRLFVQDQEVRLLLSAWNQCGLERVGWFVTALLVSRSSKLLFLMKIWRKIAKVVGGAYKRRKDERTNAGLQEGCLKTPGNWLYQLLHCCIIWAESQNFPRWTPLFLGWSEIWNNLDWMPKSYKCTLTALELRDSLDICTPWSLKQRLHVAYQKSIFEPLFNIITRQKAVGSPHGLAEAWTAAVPYLLRWHHIARFGCYQPNHWLALRNLGNRPCWSRFEVRKILATCSDPGLRRSGSRLFFGMLRLASCFVVSADSIIFCVLCRKYALEQYFIRSQYRDIAFYCYSNGISDMRMR